MTAATIDALENNGYSVKAWDGRNGTRYYLRDQYGTDAGYLVDADDGSTGTCRNVTRRRGFVKGILREAR